MTSGRLCRQSIALIAAYAMALQTLFAAFVPPASALVAGSFAMPCSHDAGVPGQPIHHDLPCAALCAAMGHGVAGPAPPDFVAAFVMLPAIAAIGPVSEWVPPRIALTHVHAPRGPPLG